MLTIALMTAILADGIIDAAEAQTIKDDMNADGAIDRDEANQLFELADGATQTCPEFDDFFCEAIYAHLSEDDNLDEAEIDWLVSKIGADGKVSDLEKRLLHEIEVGVGGTLPEKLAALLA